MTTHPATHERDDILIRVNMQTDPQFQGPVWTFTYASGREQIVTNPIEAQEIMKKHKVEWSAE